MGASKPDTRRATSWDTNGLMPCQQRLSGLHIKNSQMAGRQECHEESERSLELAPCHRFSECEAQARRQVGVLSTAHGVTVPPRNVGETPLVLARGDRRPLRSEHGISLKLIGTRSQGENAQTRMLPGSKPNSREASHGPSRELKHPPPALEACTCRHVAALSLSFPTCNTQVRSPPAPQAGRGPSQEPPPWSLHSVLQAGEAELLGSQLPTPHSHIGRGQSRKTG